MAAWEVHAPAHGGARVGLFQVMARVASMSRGYGGAFQQPLLCDLRLRAPDRAVAIVGNRDAARKKPAAVAPVALDVRAGVDMATVAVGSSVLAAQEPAMTPLAQRLSKSSPARLECHSAHSVRARASGSGPDLDSEDLPQIITPITVHDAAGSSIAEAEAFRLNMQFMHAHGVPKGEFTTFSNAGVSNVDVMRADTRGSTRSTRTT